MRIEAFGLVLTVSNNLNSIKKNLILDWKPFGISTIEGGMPAWYVKRLFKNRPRAFDDKKVSDIECLQELCLADFGCYPSAEYCEKLLTKIGKL
jgi:hypothetical protein